jgi:DNA-binding ferritin-like protein
MNDEQGERMVEFIGKISLSLDKLAKSQEDKRFSSVKLKINDILKEVIPPSEETTEEKRGKITFRINEGDRKRNEILRKIMGVLK